MRCPNPKNAGVRGVHPCGGCIICRKNKGKAWAARIMLEDQFNPPTSWFVTLTYADESVPRTPYGDLTLDKKRTCQWVRDQVKEHGFRYYLVGEYGEKTHRPHYHLAVFPDDPFWDINQLLNQWAQRRGFSTAHPLEAGSAAYLAQYTVKKLTAPDDARLEAGQEPEFRTSSRDPAIARSAIEPIASAYETRSGSLVLAERGDIERHVRINGKKWPLDAYLKTQLRKRLGIPLKHEQRLLHEGYQLWHEIPELEQDLVKLEVEVTKHAKKKNAKRAAV